MKSNLKQKPKIIIWLALVFLLSLGLWRYIDYILNVVTPNSWRFDIEPLGIFNLFSLLTACGLGIMLFYKKRWAAAAAGIVGLSFILVFGASWLNFLGVGVTALMFLGSYQTIGEELKERAKINTRITLRKGTHFIFVALALLTSFAAYQSPVADSLASMDRLPSSGSLFVRNIAESVVVHQLPKEVPPEQRDQVIEEVTQRANSQLNTIFQAYKEFAPPALALTLFLVFWGVGWIFVWLSVLFGVLIFWLLRRFKVVIIEEYDMKGERMVI